MSTFDWIFIAFCFLSFAMIARMNIRLRLSYNKIKPVTMLFAVVAFILGMILLGEESLSAIKRFAIYILLSATFFSIVSFLYISIAREEREMEERRKRCIR